MQEQLLCAIENNFESAVNTVACPDQRLLSVVKHHSEIVHQFMTIQECDIIVYQM